MGSSYYPDYSRTLGNTSQIASDEWSTFLQRRRDLLGEMNARSQLAGHVGPQVADAAANAHQLSGQNADGTPTQAARAQGTVMDDSMLQLLGAAEFYGIQGADRMQPQKLKQLVESRRTQIRDEPGGANTAPDDAGSQARKYAEQVGASMFVGAGETLLNVAQRLPFIGDAIHNSTVRQNATKWLGMVDEGNKAGMNAYDEQGLSFNAFGGEHTVGGYRTGKMLGGGVAMLPITYATWEMSSKLLGAAGWGAVTAPFARAAAAHLLRGAATGAMAEGLLSTNNWQTPEEKEAQMRSGAIGGAAFSILGGALESLPALFQRLRGRFGTASDVNGQYNVRQDGPAINNPQAAIGNVSDAEWSYVNEPGQLGPGTPQMPAGNGPTGLPGDFTPPPMQGPGIGLYGGPAEGMPMYNGQPANPQIGLMPEGMPGPRQPLGASRQLPAGPGPSLPPEMQARVSELDGHLNELRAQRQQIASQTPDQYTANKLASYDANIQMVEATRGRIIASAPTMPTAAPNGPTDALTSTGDLQGPPIPTRGPLVEQRMLGTPEQNRIQALESQLRDVTNQRDLNARLAETDGLTGLGNRTALMKARVNADADNNLGYAVFDGKGFKRVNDAHGHAVGDQAIIQFGAALHQAAAELGVPSRAFRPGGDEFIAIVPKAQLEPFRQRVEELSSQTFDGGITTYLEGSTHDDMDTADLALLNQRSSRRNLPQEEFGQPPASAMQVPDRVRGPGMYDANTNPLRGLPLIESLPNMPGGPLAGLPMIEEPLLDLHAASSDAVNYTKQATIMESPVSAEIAKQPSVDDIDVVNAAKANYPGRVAVVQNIGDLGKTIRQMMLDESGAARMMPHEFRVVTHDVEGVPRADLLVSDGRAISNKMVKEYERYGMFSGQDIQAGSYAGRLVKPASPGELATIEDMYSGQRYDVPAESILPWRGGATMDLPDAEAHYQQFVDDAVRYMNDEGQAAGLTKSFDWTSPETASQRQRLLDHYLDEHGFSGAERAAFKQYAVARTVQDYQNLVPDELGAVQQLTAETNAEVVQNYLRGDQPAIPVEEIAQSKGLKYIPNLEAPGGTIIDQFSHELRVPVAHDDAALEFIRNFNREVPDLTPASDVPYEVMSESPHSANPGDTTEPVQHHEEARHEEVSNEITRAEREHNELVRQVQEMQELATRADRLPVAPPQPPAGGGSAPPRGVPPLGASPAPASLPSSGMTLGEQLRSLRSERPSKLYEIEQLLDSTFLRYATPFRSLTIRVQNALQDVGVSEGILWKHYSDMVTGIAQSHNAATPWHEEWADIMTGFRRKFKRDGTVVHVEEIGDMNAKIAEMQRLGYTPAEMAAQGRIRDFNNRFFQMLVDDPAFNMDSSRYIHAYMSRVRQNQAMGVRDPYRDDSLPEHLKFFAEMAREGNLQFRQMDAGVVGAKMIRAAMFKKHVGEPWSNMVKAWDDPLVQQNAPQLHTMVRSWLDNVRTGGVAGKDATIQGVRYTLNKLGIPATDSDVHSLWNELYSTMYRSQLGGRPDAIFRDSIQPLMSGTRIGFKHVAKAYVNYLKAGPEGRALMRQMAEEAGFLERGQTRVANADVFTQTPIDTQGDNILSPEMLARREMVNRVLDRVSGVIPRRLKSGIQGSLLDPLLGYTKLGEFNRLIAGHAGLEAAQPAIAEYVSKLRLSNRGDGSMVANNADALMNKLMVDSRAIVYPRPIRQEFQRLIGASDYEGAANLLANESANSQFRYGARENPIGIREAGNVGRAGMMFGTFTQQYFSFMREGLSADIPVAERVAFLLRHGAITAVLGGAASYTGWKFNNWMWHQSLTFAGSPLAQGAWHVLQAGSGAITSAMGNTPSLDQATAMRQVQNSSPLASAANMVNPYASTIATIEKNYNMANSINPIEGTVRANVTGEGDLRSDFRQYFENQGVNFNPNGLSESGMLAPPRMPTSGRSATAAVPITADYSRLGVPNPVQATEPGKPGLAVNKFGHEIYTTNRMTPDGKFPTHRLDIASGRHPDESWEQYEDRINATPVSAFSSKAYYTDRNIESLVPEMSNALQHMLIDATNQGVNLDVGETLRPQERQEFLFKQGRSLKGGVATWTLTSNHAQGRAADLVPKNPKDYQWIQENAPKYGFNVLGSDDMGHIEMPEVRSNPAGIPSINMAGMGMARHPMMQGGGGAF